MQGRVKMKVFVFLFLTLLLFIPVANAGHEFNVVSSEGFEVVIPSYDSYENSKDIIISAVLLNSSNTAIMQDNYALCQLSLTKDQGDYLIQSSNMSFDSLKNSWVINVTGNNFTNNGDYIASVSCASLISSQGGYGHSHFEITPTNQNLSNSKLIVYIVLILFFLGVDIILFYGSTKINYEKWHSSIVREYEDKNFAKFLISSMGYNTMKNSFIWYYLAGLPVILMVTEICYLFGIESMNTIMQVILSVYWVGFILVGLFFFGYLQEWIMKTVDEIKSKDFGV